MDGFDGATIFLSFILTIFVYLLVPILSLGINGGKKFDEKKAKKIALWNSIIVGFIFCVLTINSGSAWSAAPALFYYFINKKLLTEKDSGNSPEDASSLDHFISQNNIEETETKKAISEMPIVKEEPKPEPKKQVRPDSEYDRRITELERQLNELKAEREAELKANSKLKEDEEGQMYIDF
jgi:hypothetical protein